MLCWKVSHMTPVQCTYAKYTGHVTCDTHTWYVTCTHDMCHPPPPCRVTHHVLLSLVFLTCSRKTSKSSSRSVGPAMCSGWNWTLQWQWHIGWTHGSGSTTQVLLCSTYCVCSSKSGTRLTQNNNKEFPRQSPTKDHYRNGVMPVAWISVRTWVLSAKKWCICAAGCQRRQTMTDVSLCFSAYRCRHHFDWW